MGLRTLANRSDDMAALYCSTSDVAFGPVIYADAGCADNVATAFCRWLPQDARVYSQQELSTMYGKFCDEVRNDGDRDWNMEKIDAILEKVR